MLGMIFIALSIPLFVFAVMSCVAVFFLTWANKVQKVRPVGHNGLFHFVRIRGGGGGLDVKFQAFSKK